MNLAILIPVLRRPQNVAPLLASIGEHTTEPHRVLFICDHGDEPEQQAIRDAGAEFIEHDGSYAAKINAGIRRTSEPFLFLGADDIRFHTWWLEAAGAEMHHATGVVGTNDLGNPSVLNGTHATHSLVARWYADIGSIDDPDVFLHEGYRHCFVDTEMVATAKRRNAWAFASDSYVEHMHPDWGKGRRDEIYDLGHSNFTIDGELFQSRRSLWA